MGGGYRGPGNKYKLIQLISRNEHRNYYNNVLLLIDIEISCELSTEILVMGIIIVLERINFSF